LIKVDFYTIPPIVYFFLGIRNINRNTAHQMITLTKEERDYLDPKKAVQILKDGNKRFIENLKMNRNLLEQVNNT
jgi:hypothetical protein